MRRRLITLLIAIVALLGSATAQEMEQKRVIDFYHGGEVIQEYNVGDVDSIKFELKVPTYRIKNVASGKYMNAANYNSHADGTVGGVNCIDYAESDDQIFTFTKSGSNYILTTLSGYNIVCQSWNVDALKTSGTALTFVDNGDGTYCIKNGSKYFKIELVNGTYYPYCDAEYSQRATWKLEEVGVNNAGGDTAPDCTVSVTSTVGGRATVGGTATVPLNSLAQGDTLILTATPNVSYEFLNWTVNGVVVSTENPYTAIITSNTEYIANFEEASNMENGHKFVDLGLSVKWATCNVGANSPEEYGDYFAWGETEPKTTYNLSTYKYCNGTYDTMTKYCTNSSYGTVDNKTTLELTDDAARVNWGGKWRMPTKAEQDELKSKCTWTWTTQNGVNGYRLTSKINGNFIFLPAAGYRDYGSFYGAGSGGNYWSSSLNTSDSRCAYYLDFYLDSVDLDDYIRYDGQSVRAVCKPIHTVSVSAAEGGTVEASATEVEYRATVTLTATPNEGYVFVYWTVNGEVVSSKNPYTATVTSNTEYIANFNKAENGHEYVDLGLPSGIKWATCNVGATTPEGYGDSFAWGETQPKDDYYWSNYKYCDGTEDTMTKYCTSSSYGTVDNKTTLELGDDAAHVYWGGNWRMPTKAEQDELRDTNNCTWTWTRQNGANGYKVTSKKNGNSIFLPAPGYCFDGRNYEGSRGYYWSSSLSTSDSEDAYIVAFDSDGVGWLNNDRNYGYSVRAVCEPSIIVCTVSVSTNTGGTATASANSVGQGGSVTLTATPNEGYEFVNWTVNGKVVSTSNPYTATITEDSEFVANFEEKIEWFRFKNVNNGYYLSFTNHDSYTTNSRDNAGMGVVAYAESSEDQLFKFEFVDNGKCYIVSKSGYYIYCTYWQCHAHKTLKTQFTVEKSGDYYTIYQAESLNQGNTSYGYLAPQTVGSGKIVYCDNAASNGYKTWSLEGGGILNIFTVSVNTNDETKGTATASANSVGQGGSVTLTATPNEGYEFVNWTVNGEVVSASNPYTATITANSEFVANFEKIEWFRLKNVNNGYYLSFTNHDSYTTNSRDNSGMGVVAYAESSEDQLFRFEFVDNGKCYIVSKSGYYIYCRYWQCHAHKTLKTQFTVEKSGDYYTIYQAESLDIGGTAYGYLAPQAVGSGKIVYCDNAASNGYKTWSLEGGGILNIFTVSVNTNDETKGTATASANSVRQGGSVTLTATPNDGYEFVNWTVNGEVVSVSNPYTVTVTANTEYIANFINKAENGHEYVDLGLPSGIKWATCNVGANSPEEYGDYFAWGETKPKDYYNWGTYKYCNGSSSTMTKYCTESSEGTVDNKTTLELGDDAALINWGGNWRMPTKAEIDELSDTNNCTWEWTTLNGVKGYKVTSVVNGNSIFLPAAGYRNDANLSLAGGGGYYWSSSLSTGYSHNALYLTLYCLSNSRYYGYSVRAVCP